jgi:hypothetical protein
MKIMATKKLSLLLLVFFTLTLLLVGCGGSSDKKSSTEWTAGKEYALKSPSYMANDEETGKKMIGLLANDNSPVLGRMGQDKVIEGIDEGAKLIFVSQQGGLAKMKYKGKEVYIWAEHLKD